MRVLLDEQIPWRLRYYFPGHETFTTAYMGWKSKGNGELLALVRSEFDVLITADKGIEYQQHVTKADVAVIVLRAKSNRLRDLRPLVPQVLNHLDLVERGSVTRIEP